MPAVINCPNCGVINILGNRYCYECATAFRSNETQQAPIPNNSESMLDLVVQEVLRRKDLGIQRYGTTLQANNGRDALQDAIEECVDLLAYLMQVKVERDSGVPSN